MCELEGWDASFGVVDCCEYYVRPSSRPRAVIDM